MIGLLRKLRTETSGVAMTELALSAPLVMMAGLWGMETANYAIVQMKISQTALHIADNMARVGDTSTLTNRKLYENDINDVLAGAHMQAGQALDLFENGRVVISSLQQFNNATHCKNGCPATTATEGKHFIWWQRCRGKLVKDSTYGSQNSRQVGGMGPDGAKVTADAQGATIFVEIFYDYQPVFTDAFLASTEINAIASFPVRNERDRTEIYKRNDFGTPAESRCDIYSATPG